MMADDLTQTHPHPMPGWIAVVPLPELDEPEAPPCAICGERHGGQQHPIAEMLGMTGQQRKLRKALVVEVGEGLPDFLTPFTKGSVVTFPEGTGIAIEDAVFMQAQSVIAWDDV